MKLISTSLLCLISLFATAQTANTLSVDDDHISKEAGIEQLSWLEGYWQGNALGGTAEEIWSAPAGRSMMFSFKLTVEGEVLFYEIGYIKEKNNSLILQLKHFDKNLHGWEEKEETIDFKFIAIKGHKVFFDGLTFERLNDNQMTVYVASKNKDGSLHELVFNYKRR
ncbi:DUF6265 family protein [Zhouia spongiae]|uniref:DUF6265 family protein n=1 Tax=Zhouia spongiae TaxID=2202721 RepID=A0ABY3YRE2_9FLAO|nr:DUF6265 family protein [Zhouia spongiae]UNZ00072.1 DUF6265 family protein [Zhouia spongiae]